MSQTQFNQPLIPMINTPLNNQIDMSLFYPKSMTQSQAKVSAALVKTQMEMGDATKGAKNPFFKSSYADLNSVREAVLPAANANGLAVLQPIVTVNGIDYVRTLVLHESGEQLHSDTRIVCAKPNDPQAFGSAVSYSRRYGLQSFFNVGAVDDDSEGAMSRNSAPKPEQKPQPKTPAETKAVSTPVEAAKDTPATKTPEASKSTSFRRPKAEPATETPKQDAAIAADSEWT